MLRSARFVNSWLESWGIDMLQSSTDNMIEAIVSLQIDFFHHSTIYFVKWFLTSSKNSESSLRQLSKKNLTSIFDLISLEFTELR